MAISSRIAVNLRTAFISLNLTYFIWAVSPHKQNNPFLLAGKPKESAVPPDRKRTFAFAKTVLFQAGLEYFALAIDGFSKDAIIIRRGFDLKELVPGDSGSQYDEPGWTDECSRKFELP